MERLLKAPLIEVIFQLRWGRVVRGDDDDVGVEISDRDEEYPPAFEVVAAEHGFTHVEQLDEEPELFQVTKRLRRGPEAWPMLQTGVGVLTVNQVNAGYVGQQFRDQCRQAVEWLLETYPVPDQLPLFGVELMYVDGFRCDDDETPFELLRSKLEVDLQLPGPLVSHPSLEGSVALHNVAFTLPAKGVELLIFNFREGKINGQRGLVMETAVRAASPNVELTPESVEAWLHHAHDLQKSSFKSIVKPDYYETFKK